jgi:hypothetical protein
MYFNIIIYNKFSNNNIIRLNFAIIIIKIDLKILFIN